MPVRTLRATSLHRVHSIQANSFLLCSSSSTSASLMFRGIFICQWILKTAKLWRTCSPSRWRTRAPADAGTYSGAAAWRQAGASRPGRQQRQAVLRPAFPRDEAKHESHPGSIAGRARAAGVAAAHRVFRHFAHPGSGDCRFDGGVGRRPDEEVGLPQVHHPRRDGVDDFASMREVVTRRYKRIRKRTKEECPAWC